MCKKAKKKNNSVFSGLSFVAPAFMRREKSGQVIATSGRKHGEGNWKRKEPFMARELRSLLFVKCILSS